MDIEKKVQILRACSSKKGERCSSCSAFGQGDRNCMRNAMRDAATALSTLQAENEKLRDEVESLKKGHCAGCSIPAVKAEQIRDLTDAPKLRAELERCREKNAGLALALLTECAPNPDCLGDDEWRAIKAELGRVKRERDAAVSDLETVMAYGDGNLDTCTFCKNGQCYERGGTKLCNPGWRGQKED